ncbi:tetratricopeptide repeat protein [candidate division WOR-3 bacterium]|nr:tetratricopeptide repeat protein [candidate division WOR-3 bacterium]
MSIKGSLNDISIADILQMLSLGNKTGELTITKDENLVNLYVESGILKGVLWMNREDKLGKILVEKGYIDDETLNKVLSFQETQPDIPLGELLLDLDLTDKETIVKNIKKQIRDTIIELSEWDSGQFVFESGIESKIKGVPVSIKIDDLLLESAALQDELKASSLLDKESILIRAQISDSELSLDENEMKVFEKIDGKRSLYTILTSLPMDEFRVLQIISKLLDEGIIIETEMDKETLEKAKLKSYEHRNLGVAFLHIGMYEEALREFNHILGLEPDNKEALFYKGIIVYESGDTEAAKEIFDSIPFGEENAAVLNNLSVIMELKGDLNTAIKYIEEAKAIEGENPVISLNKAILLIKQKKLEEAKKIIENIEQKTSFTQFYYSYVLTRLGNLEEALSELKGGLSMDPKFGEYYFNLGKIYEAMNDEKKAEEVYKKGLKIDSSSISLSKALISFYYRNKTFDVCERKIDSLISSGVEDWDLYFKKGNILFQKGKGKEAIDTWEKALKLNPDNETIKSTIETAKEHEKKSRSGF